jgi:hypothetical protein
MGQHIPLEHLDILHEGFVDPIQEMLSDHASVNFILSLASDTTVQVEADTDPGFQVAIALGGKYRYMNATVQAAVPSGDGLRDIYLTASDNDFSGPPEDPDLTDYDYGMVIRVQGSPPATDLWRKVGECEVVDGKIVWLRQTVGRISTVQLTGDFVKGSPRISATRQPDGSMLLDLVENSISAQHLLPNSVTASELTNDAVDTGALQNNSVTHPKMADDSVGNAELQDNSVGTPELQDYSVTAIKLHQQPHARVRKVAKQTVPPGDFEEETVAWEIQDFDTDSIWDPSVPSRLTCRTAGIYIVNYSLWFGDDFWWDDWDDWWDEDANQWGRWGWQQYSYIRLNGTKRAAGFYTPMGGFAWGGWGWGWGHWHHEHEHWDYASRWHHNRHDQCFQATALMKLAVNDYIQVRCGSGRGHEERGVEPADNTYFFMARLTTPPM